MTKSFVAAIDQKQAETFIATFSEENCHLDETGQIVRIFKEALQNEGKVEFSKASDKKNFEILFEDVINLNAFLDEMFFCRLREDEKPQEFVREFSKTARNRLDFGGCWENFKVGIFALLSWLGLGSFQIKIAKKIDHLARDLINKMYQQFEELKKFKEEIQAEQALQEMEARKQRRQFEREQLRQQQQAQYLETETAEVASANNGA